MIVEIITRITVLACSFVTIYIFFNYNFERITFSKFGKLFLYSFLMMITTFVLLKQVDLVEKLKIRLWASMGLCLFIFNIQALSNLLFSPISKNIKLTNKQELIESDNKIKKTFFSISAIAASTYICLAGLLW